MITQIDRLMTLAEKWVEARTKGDGGSPQQNALRSALESALKQGEPVTAQHRFRHPQKTMPGWSVWQPARVDNRRPAWTIDTGGYEVEYRLLYAAPQRPMTLDQIDDLAESGCFLGDMYEIVRAVELAHGIKE
jgi:hypothetical protein